MNKKQIDKSLKVCPPTCSVCDYKATGYHYDVPSCNGCKTFFRRAIVLEKKYKCPNINNCYSSPPKEKRSRCKCCRFRKCVEVGMDPLCIQRSANISHNKQVEQYEKQNKIRSLVTTRDERLSKSIDYLIHLENKPMPDWPLDRDMQNHLGVLHLQTVLEKGKTYNKKYWLIFDIITTIEYTKTFPFFHELNDSDKFILIRGVVLLCYNLTQIFYSYSQKSSTVTFPDGTFGFSSEPNTPYGFVGYKRNNAINIMNRERLTRSEYVLLKQLMICNIKWYYELEY